MGTSRFDQGLQRLSAFLPQELKFNYHMRISKQRRRIQLKQLKAIVKHRRDQPKVTNYCYCRYSENKTSREPEGSYLTGSCINLILKSILSPSKNFGSRIATRRGIMCTETAYTGALDMAAKESGLPPLLESELRTNALFCLCTKR